MNKQIITFKADEQSLIRVGGVCHYTSDTVSYIEAHFELGENWQGYDSVRAVWFTQFVSGISTVLDADGKCIVPSEVLRRKCKVEVNLVGSISVDNVLTDRLTTEPIVGVVVDKKAMTSSTETAPVTPSQFDQFVSIVQEEVGKVTGMTAEATTLPAGSEATASYDDGVLSFGIPKGDTGETGATGPAGADGFSPIVTVTEISGGHEVSIEDAEQTQTFDVMDGVTPVIPWDSILPIDTASGDIASFPDGSELVPARSVKVELEPIQDLHGYDKPWSGGNGKNKFSGYETISIGGSNPRTQDYRINAITEGEYTFSATASGTWKIDFMYNGETIATSNGASPFALTIPSGKSVNRIYVYMSTTDYADGKVGTLNKIQIESGTTATSYAPYSNICPISGRAECVTERTGVNVWDEEWEAGAIANSSGQNSSLADTVRSKGYIAIKPSTQYYVKTPTTAYIRFYDADKTYLGSSASIQNISSSAFTTPSGSAYMRFYAPISGSVYGNNISINYPSTDHEYHAYQGTTYTTDLGQTVYGGTLDVVSGELVVDRAVVTFDGSSDEAWTKYNGGSASAYAMSIVVNGAKFYDARTTYMANYLQPLLASATWGNYDAFIAMNGEGQIKTGIRSITNVADWRTYLAKNPLEVVYELAEPQSYSLQGQDIDLLHGTNNLWSDGEIEVEYNADIQLYIEKKLG